MNFSKVFGRKRHSAEDFSQSEKVAIQEHLELAPLISVVIPCYNYGAYIVEAIASVESQSYAQWEIIVVDGGSSDPETLETLKQIKQNSRLKIHFRDGRHFAGDNRNFGVSHSIGEFVCCLDADDRMHSTFLEKAMFVMLTEDLDIVSSSAQMFGGDDMIEMAPEFPTVEGMLEKNEINTMALVRKSLWLEVGGMRDWGIGRDYFFEDWDFWMRCLLSGAKAKNISREPLFLYRKHGDESLSQQSGLVGDLEVQRKRLLEANLSLVEKWNRGEVTVRRSHPSFKRFAGEDGRFEELILIPTFSDLLENSTGGEHDLLQVTSGKSILVVCMEEDPRGRQFVEFHAEKRGFTVFELSRFLERDRFSEFLCALVDLHSPKKITIWTEAAGKGVVEVENFSPEKAEECLTKMSTLESAPTRLTAVCSVDFEVLEDTNPFSKSNRAWFAGVDPVDQDPGVWDLFIGAFSGDTSWKKQPCNWSKSGFVFEGYPGSKVSFMVPENLAFCLLAHSHGGIVLVTFADKQFKIDLYSPCQKYVTVIPSKLSDLEAKSEIDCEIDGEGQVDSLVTVSLKVLEAKSEHSNGNEAWLEDIRLDSGQSLINRSLTIYKHPSWDFHANAAAPRGYAFKGMPGEAISFELPLGTTLQFLTHDWSGIVELTVGESVEKLDLYSVDRDQLEYIIN